MKDGFVQKIQMLFKYTFITLFLAKDIPFLNIIFFKT